MRPSSYFLVAIIVLMIALVSWSLTYPDLETIILPLMFSAVTLVLAIAQIIIENRNVRKKPESPKDGTDSAPVKESYAAIAGWLIGLLCGVYVLGLLIATTLFVCLYIKLHGRGWGIAITLALMYLAFSYGLFVLVLRIHLYSGLLSIS